MKLANQETELVGLLNQLPHGPAELAVVRERARLLCQGKLERGKTVLPMKLAIFLFQVLSKNSAASPEDKELGFKTGLTALSMSRICTYPVVKSVKFKFFPWVKLEQQAINLT